MDDKGHGHEAMATTTKKNKNKNIKEKWTRKAEVDKRVESEGKRAWTLWS